MKKTIAVIACAAALASCGGGSSDKSTAKQGLNDKGVKLAQAVFSDEVKNTLSGNQSLISSDDAMKAVKLNGRITSAALSKAYGANEKAADEKFRDKTYIVSGTIQSIGKDTADTPYLQLNGDNIFKMVNAYFDRKSAGDLAKMSKNQNISLVCDIKNYIVGQVALKDCQTLSSYAPPMIAELAKMVPDVITGKKSINPGADKSIQYAYALRKHLPENSACHSDPASKPCQADMANISKEEKEKIKTGH
ncbi:MAG: hypothetical protein GX776_10695 [Oxalobacter sp.]|nr:hypothetical protein [Oxalobacter sp.]